MKQLLIALAMILTINTASAEKIGRPMIVHKVAALGLEIWTEMDPLWHTKVSRKSGATTFVAETPALVYPPAHMSWTSLPNLTFSANDLHLGARGALDQVAANHHIRSPQDIPMWPKQYGDLIGYEIAFDAISEHIPVTVRAFCGHQPGKPAVLMQVSTLRDKLPHLSEHIRRSWTHVRYLQ